MLLALGASNNSTMATTGLFIDLPTVCLNDGSLCIGDAGSAYLKRMELAKVPVVLLGQEGLDLETTGALFADTYHTDIRVGSDPGTTWPKPGLFLGSAAEHDIDLASSWVITADVRVVKAAQMAGLIGAVLLEHVTDEPPKALGFTLARARDLADAPRVMIPPKGGCWHDHR